MDNGNDSNRVALDRGSTQVKLHNYRQHRTYNLQVANGRTYEISKKVNLHSASTLGLVIGCSARIRAVTAFTLRTSRTR